MITEMNLKTVFVIATMLIWFLVTAIILVPAAASQAESCRWVYDKAKDAAIKADGNAINPEYVLIKSTAWSTLYSACYRRGRNAMGGHSFFLYDNDLDRMEREPHFHRYKKGGLADDTLEANRTPFTCVDCGAVRYVEFKTAGGPRPEAVGDFAMKTIGPHQFKNGDDDDDLPILLCHICGLTRQHVIHPGHPMPTEIVDLEGKVLDSGASSLDCGCTGRWLGFTHNANSCRFPRTFFRLKLVAQLLRQPTGKMTVEEHEALLAKINEIIMPVLL